MESEGVGGVMEEILKQVETWMKEAEEEADEAIYDADNLLAQGRLEAFVKVHALIKCEILATTDNPPHPPDQGKE